MRHLAPLVLAVLVVLLHFAVLADDGFARRTTAGMMNGYGLAEYADYASNLPKRLDCHLEKHACEDSAEERLTLDVCDPESGDGARADLVSFFIAGIAEGLGRGAYVDPDRDIMEFAPLLEMSIPELYAKEASFPGIKRVPVRALVERELQCARGEEVGGNDPCSDQHLLTLVKRWRNVK